MNMFAENRGSCQFLVSGKRFRPKMDVHGQVEVRSNI